MSCKESFYFNYTALANRWRITSFDFPGFGASSPIEYAWSVADYAAFTAKFMTELGLEKPCVIAHSFGARVAIKLAATRPESFSAMVITGGAGVVRERSKKYRRRVACYRMVKRFAPGFAERHFGSPEYRTLNPVMRESYKKIVNEDLLADAGRITCRTLLIYGREDGVTPFNEEGYAFNRAICGSQLVTMDGGHFCFTEHPQEFNALAEGFFG